MNEHTSHVRTDGTAEGSDATWEARYVRDPDAQSPAGGASSTVRDLSRWMRLQLANGELDGDRIIAADPLERTHVPEIVSHQPPAPASTASAGTSPTTTSADV
ncbi:hypothetical protein [Streptomyces stelliscabiei]|uniref:hypothetical protein n=1 Tax=Streptomyces stelliscabiei TaxID=146820 RepID=UPI0029B1E6D6|nr:hypothetical protein [Streptomyces stelliscabiei]MDX2555011.1 hypothetical protein [Streptomyces stelliscabiei]MDX2617309.1 hypothetical protein [Streptomyces stelliscabiei]MDX2639350.1 hypothetical protein [Streptomyces stelliscabiei]MDX2666773.1 hypothetical protein [Streptomyces stelliscabiei]MDX2712772.1 hypothetical protein [Streptomyces stelliscabiei]